MINVSQKIDCCGCSACGSVCPRNAITMQEDEQGFAYPNVDANICIECGLCEKVCPISYRKKLQTQPNVISAIAARSKNLENLKKSSSGGIFGILVQYVISQNGVVFGACYDQSMVVRHSFATARIDCEKFYGSKYVQSDINGAFIQTKSFLNQGKIVLFSGTPCQIEGLNLFLRKKYDNLITVDLGCHAAPSPKLFRDYVEYVNTKFNKKLSSINMREKERVGWTAARSCSLIFSDGTKIIDPPKTFKWRTLFFSRMIDRPSCYYCKFSNITRPGDFTLADFWDRKKAHPELESPNGTSSIFINTEKAQKVFDCIKSNMEYWDISIDDALQQCFQEPTWTSPKKDAFWAYYSKKGFVKAYRHFFMPSILARIINKLTRKAGR